MEECFDLVPTTHLPLTTLEAIMATHRTPVLRGEDRQLALKTAHERIAMLLYTFPPIGQSPNH